MYQRDHARDRALLCSGRPASCNSADLVHIVSQAASRPLPRSTARPSRDRLLLRHTHSKLRATQQSMRHEAVPALAYSASVKDLQSLIFITSQSCTASCRRFFTTLPPPNASHIAPNRRPCRALRPRRPVATDRPPRNQRRRSRRSRHHCLSPLAERLR